MSVLEFVKRVGRTAIGGSLKRMVGRHCVHQWKKRPDLNVLYACGEDGAFGWKCSPHCLGTGAAKERKNHE